MVRESARSTGETVVSDPRPARNRWRVAAPARAGRQTLRRLIREICPACMAPGAARLAVPWPLPSGGKKPVDLSVRRFTTKSRAASA